MMRRSVKDSVVIITGASAGIGLALARELFHRGARLSLAARRAERLDELNQSLGGQALCVPTDVSQQAQCEELIARTLHRFGRIDTLVCNAGYGFLSPGAETSAEKMQEIFQTNVFGTIDCIRPAVAAMKAQAPRERGLRGQLMIVSSVVARRALPGFGAYSATKAAQLSLAEALRVELAPLGIAVTSVHPAGTDTEFSTVSAERSGGRRPKRIGGEVRQSAETVARRMADAIERPRPEVWPLPLSRWMLALASLFPATSDRVLAKRMNER